MGSTGIKWSLVAGSSNHQKETQLWLTNDYYANSFSEGDFKRDLQKSHVSKIKKANSNRIEYLYQPGKRFSER